MTCLAGSGEAGCHMVWIGSRFIFGLMTGITLGRGLRKTVRELFVVATQAVGEEMAAGEREVGLRVDLLGVERVPSAR